MVIKGGDVEQLLTTSYVQPYVQIGCLPFPHETSVSNANCC
jgi:hypothetical protein